MYKNLPPRPQNPTSVTEEEINAMKNQTMKNNFVDM